MFDHGRLWFSLELFSWKWLATFDNRDHHALIDHGFPWSPKVAYGWLWLCMVDRSRPWLTVEDHVDHN